jgi:hypothetical protein
MKQLTIRLDERKNLENKFQRKLRFFLKSSSVKVKTRFVIEQCFGTLKRELKASNPLKSL